MKRSVPTFSAAVPVSVPAILPSDEVDSRIAGCSFTSSDSSASSSDCLSREQVLRSRGIFGVFGFPTYISAFGPPWELRPVITRHGRPGTGDVPYGVVLRIRQILLRVI